MSNLHSTSSDKSVRLPIRTKVAWGTGGIVDNLMMNGMAALILPIYNIALGVNPIWLGYAMLLPRILDAIIDPLMATGQIMPALAGVGDARSLPSGQSPLRLPASCFGCRR